jgi:glycosyltransferase involved in cell wall biosynthesis
MEYFRPDHEFNREPETIVFSGKMSYHANISMVDFLVCEIMPKVWVKHPCAQLVIVGKDPPAKIKNYARNPLVKVTGTVADIRPYLQHATVAAVPLVYGVGIQNKILEAMACTTPVVTNSTAMSALQAEAGRDILVANSSEEFSNELLRVIENPSLQRELGHAGFEYVKNNHDWNKIAKELMMIYTEVIRKQPRRSFV